MLDVISKADYFSARNDPELEAHLHRVSRDHWGMKHIQDAWALTQLLPVRGDGVGRLLALAAQLQELAHPGQQHVGLEGLGQEVGGGVSSFSVQ